MCSLATVVAPRTGKIIENSLNVFERGKNLLQNGIQKLSISVKPIVRNCVGKLEPRWKNEFSERV